jgi:RND family efflux transporter MFP subunit
MAGQRPSKPSIKAWAASLIALGVVAGGVIAGPRLLSSSTRPTTAVPPPSVAVSAPLQRQVDGRLELLGQFSAVQQVELRAQVGGTLTEIGFKDGDIVHKGNLLFLIDPTPYQIKLSEAVAQVEGAHARLDLANRELFRANSLKQTGAGSVETADQKAAEQRAAQAAVDNTLAAVRDAQFDLDHTRITAPFTGRIGTHQVSVGNLISGSRAGTSPTTLLAIIVSTDPIYLNFDMSEADYMTFLRERQKQGGTLADKVHNGSDNRAPAAAQLSWCRVSASPKSTCRRTVSSFATFCWPCSLRWSSWKGKRSASEPKPVSNGHGRWASLSAGRNSAMMTGRGCGLGSIRAGAGTPSA